MSLLADLQWSVTTTVVPLASSGNLQLLLLSTGLVGLGLIDRLRGNDGSKSEGEASETDEGDALFDDAGDGDVDDLDSWDDDLEENDDDSGAEMEPRVDELENEVANISSTVSTVRSENESISESVEEVEENVRQLLNIYEMVTRGVNPFVDDVQQGVDGQSFGLFEGDDGGSPADDIDDDLASADAESFFDDDFDDAGEEADGDAFEDDLQDDGGTDPAQDFDSDPEVDDSSGGGKSFDDLKAEFEEGDADWVETDDAEETDLEETAQVDEAEVGTNDDIPESAGDDAIQEPPDFDIQPDGIEPTDGSETTGEPSVMIEADDSPESEPEGPKENEETGAGTDGDGDTDTPSASPADNEADTESGEMPYLSTLPEGYGSELLVMEWMGYLLDRSSFGEVIQALQYYQTLGLINESVAADLERVLVGLGPDAKAGVRRTDGGDALGLTVDDHYSSLRYLSWLTEGGFRPTDLKLPNGG